MKTENKDSRIFNRPGSNITLAAGLMAILILASVGCGTPSASVYIDNGGEEEMQVTVNGDTAATIAPGDFESISLLPGDHRFIVERGEETLYDGIRTIEESDRLGFGKQYMWNPGREHRYASCKVRYGSQAFGDLAQSAMFKFAESQTGEKADPIRVEFLQVKRFAEPLPSTDWFEISSGNQYILRDAPEKVVTKSGSDSRRVVTRISSNVHRMLTQTHNVERPNEDDLNTLGIATEMALDSLSELKPIY